MGVFDIFRRKKKEEEGFGFAEGAQPQREYGSDASFSDNNFNRGFEQPIQRPFEQQPFFQPQPISQPNFNSNDLQLVLAKLDLINQRLEVLDRRLQTIEQIAKESQ